MIYAVDPNTYPSPEQCLEEISYKDQNNLEWRIARVQNGFMVRYYGDRYFSFNTFECELKSGKTVRVNNTHCILFKDESFDAFCEMRDILKNGWTDEIWDCLEGFFTERLEHDITLIESEIVK